MNKGWKNISGDLLDKLLWVWVVQNILKLWTLNYRNSYLISIILDILWFVDIPLKCQSLIYHVSEIQCLRTSIPAFNHSFIFYKILIILWSYLYRLAGWAARSIDFLPECRLFFPVPEAHIQGHTEKQLCLQVLVHPHSVSHSWGLLGHDRQWRRNLSKGRKAFSLYIGRISFTVSNCSKT